MHSYHRMLTHVPLLSVVVGYSCSVKIIIIALFSPSKGKRRSGEREGGGEYVTGDLPCWHTCNQRTGLWLTTCMHAVKSSRVVRKNVPYLVYSACIVYFFPYLLYMYEKIHSMHTCTVKAPRVKLILEFHVYSWHQVGLIKK